MAKQRYQRKKIFIDRNVQGAVILHMLGHWLCFLAGVAAVLYLVELLSGDPRDAAERMYLRHRSTVLSLLVLSPIFLRDMCKLTHRFAGPMVCLRRAINELADGRDVSPIQFRKRDFWHEVAADFNRLVEHTRKLKNDDDKAKPATSDEARDETTSQKLVV